MSVCESCDSGWLNREATNKAGARIIPFKRGLTQDPGYVYLKHSSFTAAVIRSAAQIKEERFFIDSNCFPIIISNKKISQGGDTVPSTAIA